jgi:hypothetical protein
MFRPTPSFIDRIAEERIDQAMREGAFDGIPGTGRPLQLDDEPLVPQEVRAIYRVLRNSGHLPPELAERLEAAGLERLTRDSADPGARRAALTRLALLRTRLGERRGSALLEEAHYREKLLGRLGGSDT